MGFFNTPWVSDMLDISSGQGSWNLSVNQGLAHMQANFYMNSCWSTGFSFMPYGGLGMNMDYLLNPGFASWQAINGISSNNNSIFGNFNNIFNPFQSFNTNGNSSGSGSSASSGNDINEKKCEDLTKFLKAYMNFQGNLLPAEQKLAIDTAINKSIDNDYTYEKKYKDLLALCNGIAPKNIQDLLMSGTLEIDKDIFLEDLFVEAGLDNAISKHFTDEKSPDAIAKNIKDCLDLLSDKNDNMDATNDATWSTDGNNIIAIISCYNSNYATNNLMADINSKWIDNSKKNEQAEKRNSNVAKAMTDVAKALTQKANRVIDQYNEATQKLINDYVKELKGGVTTASSDNARRNFVTAFNNLYQVLRFAAAKQAETKFKAKYGDITVDFALFKANDKDSLIEQIKEDIKSENISVIDISKIGTRTIEKDNIQTNDNKSDNNETKSQKEETIQRYLKAEMLEDTGIKVNGEPVYTIVGDDFEGQYKLKGGELCTFDDNGKPHPLKGDEKRLYGVEVTKDTLLDIEGHEIYIWSGLEKCNGIEVGEPCTIKDGRPQKLINDEIKAYGLETATEIKDAKYQGYQIYYWESAVPYNNIEKDDMFINKNGTLVAIEYDDQEKVFKEKK